jgi:hypothetical protein
VEEPWFKHKGKLHVVERKSRWERAREKANDKKKKKKKKKKKIRGEALSYIVPCNVKDCA